MQKFEIIANNSEKNSRLAKFIDKEKKQNKLYVRISTGCLNDCSYCVIKRAKDNKLVSRPISEIIKNIKDNLEKHESIYLVADDCGSYGQDINTNIFNLIYQISTTFPGNTIDLDYINPRWIAKYPKKYLQLFKKYKIGFVCLPIQSGSDRILKLMNRHYKIEDIIRFLVLARKLNPNMLIISHFLIGFPTETWKDVLLTMRAAFSYDYGYAFPYADRAGTPSKDLMPKVQPILINLFTKITLFFILINFFIKIFGNLFLKPRIK